MIVEHSQLRSGRVRITGHKHTAVPLIASAITLGRVVLTNVPVIRDTTVLTEILVRSGASVTRHRDRLEIDTTSSSRIEVPQELSSTVHGSLYLVAPVLGRWGRMEFTGRSGGCMIGDRSRDGARPTSHIRSVLSRFGAAFETCGEGFRGQASGLAGCDVDVMDYSDDADVLTGPLVSGATKTAILAAMSGIGTTRIRHPYPKPDAMELLDFASRYGFDVRRTQDEVVIHSLRSRCPAAPVQPFRVISDLSQIITFICASVWCGVKMTLELTDADQVRLGLGEELRILQQMGIRLEWRPEGVDCIPPSRLRSVDIDVTSVGIYSDHQPFFALMLLKGDRPARIRERVWRDRFTYAPALAKLGARLELQDDALIVHPSTLRAPGRVTLEAHDLRTAAVLLLAALSAEGDVYLKGTDHLQRGYEGLIDDLRALGASFRLS